MKKLKLMICLVGSVLLGACSDFLEEESQDEVIVKSVADYSEFLLGSGYPRPAVALFAPLYLFDDDVEINEKKFVGQNEITAIINRMGFYTWQPDMWESSKELTESYSQMYNRVMGVNATLDYIDDAVGNPEEREQVKAEAFGVRGYIYYMLVNHFGEPYAHNKEALGVVLKLTSDLKENGFQRNTVEKVYAQIVNDLKTSSDLFEKYPKRRGNYRINICAVNILLSRVYLYMEEWDNAIDAADKAIKYAEGLTDYTQIPRGTKFYLTNYDHSEVEWVYGSGEQNYKRAIQDGFRPSDDLMSKFKPGDRRLDLWFSADGLIVTKNRMTTPRSPSTTMRISEAFLNRAEAYVQENKLTEALADLNDLRRHRIEGYQDVSYMDKTKVLDEVRLERRLELCFDEQRWFDLRRYGMPAVSHDYKVKKGDNWVVYRLKEKDALYTLPIPNAVIENNGKLEQNASAKEPERTGVQK